MIKVQLFNNYAQLLIWIWPVFMANRRHVNCSWKLKTCPCGLIWLSHGKLVIEKWIVVYSSFYMVINVVFVWGLSICCCNAASFFFFFFSFLFCTFAAALLIDWQQNCHAHFIVGFLPMQPMTNYMICNIYLALSSLWWCHNLRE